MPQIADGLTPAGQSLRSIPRMRHPRLSLPALAVSGLFLLLSLLSTSLAAGPARAEAGMLKGLQDIRLVTSDIEAQRQLFWRSAERADVRRVRVLVSWDGHSTEVDPDVLFRLRRAIVEGDEAGARLFVGLYAGINRSYDRVPVNEKMIERYSQFTASLGAGLEDLPIAAYLTWNEPNYNSMWPPKRPRTWVQISNAAYRSFKRTDPDTPVLVGEPAPNARTTNAINPGRFFRQALCLDANWRSLNGSRACRQRLLGDGIAIHTHDFSASPLATRTNPDSWTMGNLRSAKRQIKALARAGRISRKASRNIHITEFAYRTSGSAKTPDGRAAQWLRQAWQFARREGIRSFTWYQLQDPGSGHGWTSGLVTARGAKTRQTWKTFVKLR